VEWAPFIFLSPQSIIFEPAMKRNILPFRSITMEHHHIPRGTPFRQNSSLFRVHNAFSFCTVFMKNTSRLPRGSGYFSFHWLKPENNDLQEITRDYFYFDKKTPLCIFWSNPPPGATHLMLGIRINCEEANVSPTPFDVSFQNMKICRVIRVPKHFYVLYSRIRNYYRLTPISLNIELASFCNLRCIWCILDHTKEKKKMDFDLFKDIVSEIVLHRKDIRRIDLHNGGEVLLHPHFKEFIRYFGISRKNTPDFPYTALLTNTTRLNPELSQAILDSRALDLIRFSIDGGTPEEYERIRKGADFQTTYLNVKKFVEMNNLRENRILTGIICIIDEKYPLSTEWMDPLFKDLMSLVDLVELRRPHNFNGSVEIGIEREKERQGVCQFIKNNNIVVLPDGSINLCCADINARGIVGNIREMTLVESLTCAKRREVIRAMEKNERKKIKLCRNCDLY